MEHIIDQLRQHSESSATPLELPDEEQLVVVEEEILIPIPYDFRTFLLEVSDVICGRVEPATVADPRSHTHLPEMAAVAWSLGMPREYIPICEYDGGYACISQDAKIYFWLPSGMTDTSWEDIWHWCDDVWLR